MRRFVSLWMMVLVLSANAVAAPDVAERLLEQHQQLGRTLDQAYYDAGRRIDIAVFDLAEVKRQGRDVDARLLQDIRRTDARLRERFIEIDEVRASIFQRVRALPPAARYVLKFEVTASPEAGKPWFGVAEMTLALPSGEELPLRLDDFAPRVRPRNYSYQVPPRRAVFIYGRPSDNYQMQLGFTPARDLGEGAGVLTLTGLDALQRGATPIRITLNEVEIFSGDNPFVDHDWHTHEFPIPAEAWTAPPPAADEARHLEHQLAALLVEVERFGRDAAREADRIDRLTQPLRHGLVYQPRRIQRDFWRHHFIRGMCNAQFDQDYEHQVKAFHHIGVNLLYSYAGRYSPLDELPQLLEQTSKVGMPVFLNPSMLKNESRKELRLGQPELLAEEVQAYLRKATAGSDVHVDVAADEPNFRDELGKLPAVQQAFADYLATRRSVHESAGIGPLEAPKVLPPEYGDGHQRVLWMEWQLFRRDFFAQHFGELWDRLDEEGLTTFTIIQHHHESVPQYAAYSSFARRLPLISTDIYRDGGMIEAFTVQLLSNAGDSVAVFTAGSGYSSKTPDRLARSMAIAMTHADGLLEWTDLYLAKYRDPRAFWRSGSDDRGRSILGNWHPRYWDVTAEMYGRMELADPYLAADSAARVAILLSERTMVAQSHGSPKAYRDRALSLYSHLVRQGIPMDAVLVEAAIDGRLDQYDLVILPDARVLTAEEEQALRAWVDRGGVLVASGAVSAFDPWGRPRGEMGLGDVLGVELTQPAGAPGEPPTVAARPGARVVLADADGGPILVHHHFGAGEAWYTTDVKITAATPSRDAVGGAATLHEFLSNLVKKQVAGGVELIGPAANLECQLRTVGDATVIHLINWQEGRTLDDVQIRLPQGAEGWSAIDPTQPGHPELAVEDGSVRVPPFSVHQMVVLKPTNPSPSAATGAAGN